MKIFLLIFFLLSMLKPVYAQNKQALAKSDSLFARGVDLYKTGQYEEAIPLFAESDRIDKAELDSTSNRRDYSAMWLASCYYLQGDTAKAKETYLYYNMEPVDRRYTIVSDSLFSLGIACALEGNYQDAISNVLKCIEIEKSIVGEEHIWYINSLSTLIDCYFGVGNFKETFVLEKRLLKLLKISVGESNIQYVQLLNDMAMTLANLGEYEQALTPNKEALALLRKNPDLSENLITFVLIDLADCYSELDNQPMAIQYATEAGDFYLKKYGDKYPGYANSLARIALYNSQLGNFERALELALKAKEILFDSLGENHPDYISILDNLSEYYMGLGQYGKALSFSQEALDKTEQTESTLSFSYAATLKHYITCCLNLGKLQDVVENSNKVVSIMETLYGKEHPHYISAVSDLANCYATLGNYSKAIELNQEILDMTERRYGTENSSYAVILNNLASFYSEKGNNQKAIELGEKSLKMKERIYGIEHPTYINALQALATYYSGIGDYKTENEIITQALQIGEKVYHGKNVHYARLLNDYAISLSRLDNYEEAIESATKAMEIQKNTAGTNNTAYISMLTTLSNCYAGIGNIYKAQDLRLEALKISDLIYMDNPLPKIELLVSQALGCTNTGLYEMALNFAQFALDIINQNTENVDMRIYTKMLSVLLSCVYNTRKDSLQFAVDQCEYGLGQIGTVLGMEHPDCLVLLSDLSFCYAECGDYGKAIELGEKVLQAERKMQRDQLSSYTYYQKRQATNCFYGDDWKSASRYAYEATDKILKQIETNFQFLPSYDRTLFLERDLQWLRYEMPKIAYYISTDSLLSSAFDGLLFGKGMLLHTDLEIKEVILESNDTTLINLYGDILSKHGELDALYEEKDTMLYPIIDSLEVYVLNQERLLMQKSKGYGNYIKNLRIRNQDVRRSLGVQDAAIEFLKFPIKNDSVMYAAFLLRQGMTAPKMIPLFEESQLKRISKSDFYTTKKLTNLIWKPIEAELQDIRNIYFAPDGELYNIAIELLPAWEGDGWVSDERNFYRLSSTRELALTKDKDKIKSASVYGGLRYDADEQVLINDNKKYPAKRDFEVSSIADSLNLRSGVEELPATKTEAVDIDKTLAQVKVANLLYTDTLGTEASFKALSGQRRNLLHIATHGFYWTEREAKLMDHLGFLSLNNSDRPRYVEDKAMTRSGLLFAGANHALKGKALPEGVDDGILTAKEISALDLRGLDMVVLSACQTGLGEISGDGVFGLQRGFKKAGANTLLMSLWKVDDKATQMLMTQFYANLTSGKSKFESLREAQRYVREYETEVTESEFYNQTAYQQYKSERNNEEALQSESAVRKMKIKPYASPRYWAAFILLDAVN